MNTQTKKAPVAALAIFGVLTVIGVVCWVLQLQKGLQLTNLGVTNMWGLYIVGFMIFTGIAAGCLFFASLPQLLPQLAEYQPYGKIAALVASISAVVAASLFIIVDIGNPERAWQFITSPNFSSPMFWDFVMLLIYMVVSIILTRQLMVAGTQSKQPKVVPIIGVIGGLGVMITSFVFCFQVARPMWNNPVEPISFLCAAFAAALGVLIILAAVLNRSGYLKMAQESITKMGRLMAIFLAFELVVVISEALIGLYSGGGETAVGAAWLVTGAGAPLFWAEIITLVAALVCCFKGGKGLTLGGGIIGLVAIYLVKTTLLQAQLMNPTLSYAGPPLYGALTGLYFPSLIEIAISLGIVALGCFLITLGLHKLPLGEK